MLGWSNVNGASLAASSQCKGEILKDFDQVGSVHRAPYRLEMPVWKKGFAKNRQNRSRKGKKNKTRKSQSLSSALPNPTSAR